MGPPKVVVVRQIVVHHIKRMDFFLGDGVSSVWDCMLIRRSAKMLVENVDCAWPGLKKETWLSEKQLLNLRCHCIAMVQPAESRKGLNLPFTGRGNGDFCRPTYWGVLR